MPKICIIIPCYNEEKRFDKEVFLTFCETSDSDFILVNDGSNDQTISILNDLSSRLPSQVQVLNLDKNGGKAEAVRQGFMKASAFAKYEYIGYFDADFATPLDELKSFEEIIERNSSYEILMGCRIKRLGSKVERNPKRHYIGRIFATVASNILGLAVYDTQCGAKLFKSSIVPILFSERFLNKWIFDVEILARYVKNFGVKHAERSIYEVPLSNWKDVGGSKIKGRDMLIVPFELFKIFRSM